MRKLPSSLPYVFDSDCLASFLWVKRVDVLYALFAARSPCLTWCSASSAT